MDVQQPHTQEPIIEKPVKHSLLRRIELHILHRMSSGFLVLVPVLITFFILIFAFREIDKIFKPLVNNTLLDFTGFGALIALLLLYIVGSFFSGKKSQAWQDAILTRIPIARTIYVVARQATDGLTSATGQHFSRVVMIQYPRPGVHAMGFVTGHYNEIDGEGVAMVAVYIPTVPNPTSGMLAFFQESDIVETNVTVRDAMKMIFSGGVVLPKLPERSNLWNHPATKE